MVLHPKPQDLCDLRQLESLRPAVELYQTENLKVLQGFGQHFLFGLRAYCYMHRQGISWTEGGIEAIM